MSEQLQQTRLNLRALANELAKLADTYEPTPAGAFGVEPLFVTKARELVAQAQGPADYATFLMSTLVETTVIRALVFLDVFANVPESGSIGLEDLSKKTNSSPALLERLLRVVVGSKFLAQDAEGNFSHTHLSRGFTQHGIASRLLVMSFDEGKALVELTNYLDQYKSAGGIYDEPGAGKDNTYFNMVTWAHGSEGKKSTWQIMEENPERMQKFQKGLGIVAHLNPYVGHYDFGKLATPEDTDRVVFVDVGGGHGHAIKAVLGTHPEIKASQCVLQDTRNVVEFAEKEADLPKGVKSQAHDFFQPQPVKGARAYHMRAIAHDLSDANMVRLLEQIVPVMARDSKILIADNVIPEHGTQGLSALMDMMMMNIGGKERTERNFRSVLDQAGLKVDGVHRVGGQRTYAIVEASLK